MLCRQRAACVTKIRLLLMLMALVPVTADKDNNNNWNIKQLTMAIASLI